MTSEIFPDASASEIHLGWSGKTNFVTAQVGTEIHYLLPSICWEKKKINTKTPKYNLKEPGYQNLTTSVPIPRDWSSECGESVCPGWRSNEPKQPLCKLNSWTAALGWNIMGDTQTSCSGSTTTKLTSELRVLVRSSFPALSAYLALVQKPYNSYNIYSKKRVFHWWERWCHFSNVCWLMDSVFNSTAEQRIISIRAALRISAHITIHVIWTKVAQSLDTCHCSSVVKLWSLEHFTISNYYSICIGLMAQINLIFRSYNI